MGTPSRSHLLIRWNFIEFSCKFRQFIVSHGHMSERNNIVHCLKNQERVRSSWIAFTLINFKLIAFMSSTQGQQTIPCDQKMDQVVKICFLEGYSNSHKSSTISGSLKMTWWYYLLYSLMFAHFLQFLKEKFTLEK